MNVRERIEDLERRTLSPFALCSSDSQGRDVPTPPCELRTCFQRDRDRIIHCKSFRRLKYKTQCFLPDEGDHFRTRLTHTLEVSQVARTLSRALALNDDLTEAIALGHDLGHTCFGHRGESTLDRLCVGGFRHNDQSRRVVEVLERDGEGLNLCLEVRDGIQNHRTGMAPMTLEGAVVQLADKIAYLNHDIDDAVRAGVLDERDIPRDLREALGESHGARINAMIRDVVLCSQGKPQISMSEPIRAAFEQLRAFMFAQVYRRPEALAEEGKADHVLSALYMHFMQRPQELPQGAHCGEDEVRVKDFLAGMTDRFALGLYSEIFLPKPYHVYGFNLTSASIRRNAAEFDE